MDFINVNCKNCGNSVKIDLNKDKVFCSRCGAQLLGVQANVQASNNEIVETVDDTIDSLTTRAGEYIAANDFDSASKIYIQICDKYPSSYIGWEGRIVSYTKNYSVFTDSFDYISKCMSEIKKVAPADNYSIVKNKIDNYSKYISQKRIAYATNKLQNFNQERYVNDMLLKNDTASIELNKEDSKRELASSRASFFIIAILLFVIFVVPMTWAVFLMTGSFSYFLCGIGLVFSLLISAGINRLLGSRRRKHVSEIKNANAELSNTKEKYESRVYQINHNINLCNQFISFGENRISSQVAFEMMQYDDNLSQDLEVKDLWIKIETI